MSHTSRPVLLGAFVLSALLIGFSLLFLLATDRFFSDTEICVMHFTSNVDGLDVGSPVLYRGFRVGRVTEMRLILNPETGETRLPVFVGIEPRRLHFENGRELPLHTSSLANDLHAKLDPRSLITGQMAIQLVKAPGSDGNVSGVDYGVPEIPTLPNLRESLTETLRNMPLDGMVRDLQSSFSQLDALLKSGTIQKTAQSLSSAIERSDRLLGSLEKPLPELIKALEKSAGKLDQTLEEVRGLSADLRPLAANLNRDVPKTLAAWEEAAGALTDTQDDLAEAMKSLRRNLDPDTPTHRKILEAVERVEAAARSMETLADYLQRHPESLLRGKAGQGVTP